MENNRRQRLDEHYISMQVPYWMGYSVLGTFTSVYLLAEGVSNAQIGLVLSIANLFAAVIQPFMASFADRMKRLSLSQLTAGLAFLLILCAASLLVLPKIVFLVGSIYTLMYALLIMLQPMTIAIGTFFISRGHPLNFGLARGLGSLSFAGAAFFTGKLIATYSSSILPYLLIGIFLFFAVAVLLVDTKEEDKDTAHPEKVKTEHQPLDLLSFVRRYKRFMVVVLGVSCLFVFHTIINSYLFQIVQPLGGTEASVGTSLSIAAVSELPTMFFFSWLLRYTKASRLLCLASVFFLIKAVMITVAPSMVMINIAQCMQMGGFALYTMASVYYTNQQIPKKDLIKGQTIMAMANTIGGIAGSFLGGLLLSSFSVNVMLMFGTVITLIGTLTICTAIGKE